MVEIVRDTLAEAHEECVRHLLNGNPVEIETSPGKWEKTWELPNTESIMLVIRKPLKARMISDAVRFGPKSLESYQNTFTTLTPPRADKMGATYTYGNRSGDFPIKNLNVTSRGGFADSVDICWNGNGDGEGFNQIAALIKTLKKNSESRRAVVVTWCPELDAGSTEPPCCNHIQFLVRNNVVHGKFLFRSRDALSAMGENLVAEAYFLKYIVNELNKDHNFSLYKIGTLTDISNCAHIYWQRDDQELQVMKEKLGVA